VRNGALCSSSRSESCCLQHLRYQHPTCKAAVPPCSVLDPEGLFSTVGATCSVFIGLLFGFLMLQVRSGFPVGNYIDLNNPLVKPTCC